MKIKLLCAGKCGITDGSRKGREIEWKGEGGKGEKREHKCIWRAERERESHADKSDCFGVRWPWDGGRSVRSGIKLGARGE